MDSRYQLSIEDAPAGACAGRHRRTHLLLGDVQAAEVRVRQRGGGSHPLLRIGEEHALQEIYRCRFDVLVGLSGQGKLHLLVPAVDLLVFGALKERASCQQDMEDDPSREDIALGLDMPALRQLDDLRRYVPRCPAPEEQVLLNIGMRGQSIIHNDGGHGGTASHHDVLRLEIAVHDPLLVHPLQPSQQPQHKLLHLLRRKVAVSLLDAVEQLTARYQFQHHVNGVLRLEDAFQLQQVGVGLCAQCAHDAQLVYEALFSILGREAVLLREGLHREPAAVCQALDLVDRGEVALSQFFQGLEHLMEAELVELLREADGPSLDDRGRGKETHRPTLIKEQPQPFLRRPDIPLDLIDDLKLKVKPQHQPTSRLQPPFHQRRVEQGVAYQRQQEMRLQIVGDG